MRLEVVSREPAGEARETPILCVHGMWHGAWCWDENFLPYLAGQGYAAHALSVRGHCGSEGGERLRGFSLADYVSDLAQVAADLPRPPVLVGHSMGGMIVQKYLEQHAAPAAVLLASGPPQGLVPATLRFARRHPREFLKVLLTFRTYPVVCTPELAREGLFSPGIPAERLVDRYARLQDESYRAYVDMMLLNLPHPRRVNTPMLVLGAGKDRMISRREVESTAEAYHTRAEFYEDMAHDMMLEEGWQAVADRIVAWLQELGL
jgi:pimeloyl-ACP methyl ester carboxylesterase